MTAETRDLSGTVVAITGATSGIGRATARELVQQGAKVALTGRRADRLADLQQELGADNAVVVAGDVGDSWERLLKVVEMLANCRDRRGIREIFWPN